MAHMSSSTFWGSRREYILNRIDLASRLTMTTPGKYRVLYDEQCEICQAGASWLLLLDKTHLCELVPIGKPGPGTEGISQDAALRQLHVIAPDGEVYIGRKAVTELAMLFLETRAIGRFFSAGFPAMAADYLYGLVADNRYALSKCRGGACRTAASDFKKAMLPFWSCYWIGFILRLPLAIVGYANELRSNYAVFMLTRGRRFDFLDGKLKMLFLNGFPSDVVPLIFGERFTAIVYDDVAFDPGGTKLRRAVAHYFTDRSITVSAVALTHHHEEHVGNGRWLADRLAVKLWLSRATAALLMPPQILPWTRAFIIGQPEALSGELNFIDGTLPTANGALQVFPLPGHCDDELAFYDPEEKLLIAGDSFMGAYFSTPNPEVDNDRWILSLEKLMALKIEILVEAHGHIHTMRPDIPDVTGVVNRSDPQELLRSKLSYLSWLRDQVNSSVAEGLPIRAVEASCFPWVKAGSWERFINDEVVRMLTSGDFSRTRMINSFSRTDSADEIWPRVRKVEFICKNE